MPVKVADVVGGLAIAVPPEIVLHRRFGRSVRLGLHDAFIAHNRWLLVLLSAETDEVRELLEEAHGKGSPWSRRRRGNKAVDRGQGDRGDNKRQDPHHRAGHLLLLNGISRRIAGGGNRYTGSSPRFHLASILLHDHAPLSPLFQRSNMRLGTAFATTVAVAVAPRGVSADGNSVSSKLQVHVSSPAHVIGTGKCNGAR